MLLQEMEFFYYVVKLGSFSQAAERLNFSKAHISRSISKLERELKTQLLQRSTRQLSLTESGEKLFNHCQTLIQEAENAYAITSHYQEKPFGTLRISAPPAFSNAILSKFIPAFLKRYPEIKLLLELENKVVDVLSEGIDLALRTGKLKDSQLVAKPLMTFDSVLCASAKYFKQHGIPNTPEDLTKHNCCTYYHHHEAQKSWVLHKGKTAKQIDVQSSMSTNQLDLLKQMALAGVGIVGLPHFMIEKELANGELQQCLTSYTLNRQQVFAVYSARKFLPQKTKVFIAELSEFLQRG